MPAWITDLIPITPWLAAIAALVWVAVKAWPFLRKISHFIDDVAGEPARPGFEARPGLMERVSTMETKQDEQAVVLSAVHHEVFPNSGKSFRDKADQTAEAVDAIDGRLDAIEELLKESK